MLKLLLLITLVSADQELSSKHIQKSKLSLIKV